MRATWLVDRKSADSFKQTLKTNPSILLSVSPRADGPQAYNLAMQKQSPIKIFVKDCEDVALSPSSGTGARLQAERCQFPETVARSQVVECECGENPAYKRTHAQTHPSLTDGPSYVRTYTSERHKVFGRSLLGLVPASPRLL